MRTQLLITVLSVALAACAGGATADSTTTSTSAATTTTTTTTTTTITTTIAPTTTSTTAPTTTTTEPPAALPADACEQIDLTALQSALGVAEIRPGSPFTTTLDGASANCRFAVTLTGNLGSAFNIIMIAPSPTGAFEDALSTLDVGEPTLITGVGTRAHFYETAFGSLGLVEYENGSAAWASGADDNYRSGAPDATLMAILDTIVGPIMRAIS